MASELQLTATLNFAKAGITIIANNSVTITQSGSKSLSDTQNIGTTTEAVTMIDVSTPGYFFFKNLDATNFIMIGLTTAVTSGNAFLKLLPGEFAICPCRQTTIYAIADTAACNLQVVIIEL